MNHDGVEDQGICKNKTQLDFIKQPPYSLEVFIKKKKKSSCHIIPCNSWWACPHSQNEPHKGSNRHYLPKLEIGSWHSPRLRFVHSLKMNSWTEWRFRKMKWSESVWNWNEWLDSDRKQLGWWHLTLVFLLHSEQCIACQWTLPYYHHFLSKE